MRPTVEGRRKAYIDLGDLEAFALHRGDRLFPLRESEPVRVTDADPEDSHIELELESSRLGRGRVDFHGAPPAAEDFERWLDAVFEVVTPAAREPFHRADDALDAGYHRCGVCFVPTPDVSDYETELAAILAHEIAHVESRHSYRIWRNAQKTSFWTGLATGLAAAATGMDTNAVNDLVATMSSFTAQLFMAGHGRDRDIGDRPLLNAFRKLKFARDAYDPFGWGGGLFASHPHIEERLDKASATLTAPFPPDALFHGVRGNGALVATLRFDVQRLSRNELDVVATLSTTAELGEEDNVNTLTLHVAGQPIELRERTAEKIFPSDEVSAVFGTDRAGGLIEGEFSASLKLRNVDRWQRASRR